MKYDVKIKKLPKSEIEMEISLPSDLLKPAREKAIKMLSLAMDIDGFRKGHIPEKIVIEKAGEYTILEESADIILKEHFPLIIEQEKLDIVGRPNITITKLAENNPIEFKATFAIVPEFKLPKYKEIAKKEIDKKEDEVVVSEKEVEDVLLQIRKNKAHFDWHKNNPEDKEHNHPDLEKEENLPELNDQLAKEAGDFKDLEDLKSKIKENISEEKKYKNLEKRRARIMEELLKNTEIDIPDILVDSETEKSLAQMKDSIERMGSTFADYLKHINKTEDDIKNEFRESSSNKAKIQLIFNKIAEEEKLEIDKTILENEVKQILEHYPNSNETSARIYVSTILINNEVLKLLESQSG